MADAARGLASFDAEAAAELCSRALDLCAPGDEVRPGLVADLALLLHAIGRAEEGKQVADDARSDRLEPEGEAAILLSIARMPDLAPAVRTEAGRDALALPGLPRPLRARHLSEWIGNLLSEGQLAAARRELLSVESTIAACEDDVVLDALGAARAQLAYVDGTYGDALRQLDEIGTTTRDADEHARLAGLLRGESLVAIDEFDAAHRLGIGRHRRCGTRSPLVHGKGVAPAPRARDVARGSHPVGGRHTRRCVHCGERVRSGRPATRPRSPRSAAWRSMPATRDGCGSSRRSPKPFSSTVHPRCGGTRRGCSRSVPPQAVTPRRRGTGSPRSSRTPTRPCCPASWSTRPTSRGWCASRATSETDALARATVAAADQARLTNPDVASIVAAAAHAAGSTRATCSSWPRQSTCSRAAGGAWPSRPALEDYATGVVGQGDRANAVDALTRALKLYSGCGAAWDASRVRRRLRDLGVRRRIVKAARPASGWAGLTDGELAVVRLVAEGLTNREVAERLYVSPHTVSMHLRHVFTKLSITSRVELTRLVYQHEKAA